MRKLTAMASQSCSFPCQRIVFADIFFRRQAIFSFGAIEKEFRNSEQYVAETFNLHTLGAKNWFLELAQQMQYLFCETINKSLKDLSFQFVKM